MDNAQALSRFSSAVSKSIAAKESAIFSSLKK
jgi:hypothetical protein